MFHKSKLGEYDHRFPHDQAGHVPVHRDHWQQMQFDHADMDPHEDGISGEESTRRLEYLNQVWWPAILQRVNDERQRLETEYGQTFTKHWHDIVYQSPKTEHGFGVGVE